MSHVRAAWTRRSAIRYLRSAALLVSLVCATGLARAQGVAGLQDIDTSIRSSGMGGATTAVGWGEPGAWGNPATLASVRGVAWLEGTTRLLPEFDPPIRLKSRRFLLGGAGVGVLLMDGPGHTRLEYQPGGGTDPFGNPTSGPKQVDETEGWGFALAPMQILDAIRGRAPGDAASLARRIDVSAGYQRKNTKLTLIPGVVAEAGNFDWGVLARVGLLPGDVTGRETRVEISAGYAELNGDEKSHFVFPGFGDVGGSTRLHRTGFAARALLPFGQLGDSDARPWAWPSSVASAIGLGVAFDLERREDPATGFTEDVKHWGFEGTFMDVLAARVGYVDDPSSDLHSMTGGLGVHAPIGPWATLGYDWANQPSATGMKNMNRHGWSVWLHPDAVWRSWQDGRTGD